MTKAIVGAVTLVIVACLGLPVLLLSAVTKGGASGCGITAHPHYRPPGL